MFLNSLLFTTLTLLPSVLGAAGTLQQVTDNFGSNPTNVGFYIYVPAKLQANPPVLVNSHACHTDAQDAFTGTQLATLADTYGYIVIYPNSPNAADMCWDVSSSETLSHNGGGDSLGIVSMVKWTLAKYNGNANRVFAYGVSSGAMMTNVLLGSYPDVFAAGSAWAGVAFGCFAGDGFDVWSNDCATGVIIKTGAQWAAEVYAAYPGYTGFRPKMQCFHGSIDTTLNPQNLQEEIKEWTTVLGLPSTPVSTLTDNPLAGWTTWIYGSSFQATLAENVTHNIQPIESVILAWFDLTCSGTSCYSRTGGGTTGTTLTTSTVAPKTTSTKASSTTSASPTSTPGQVVVVSKYGQCGGIGYVGGTVCAAGSVCTVGNPYYSQCL